MNDYQALAGLAAAPVLSAHLNLLKLTFPGIPKRYVPATGVFLGVVWVSAAGLALNHFTAATPMIGILAGLAATGLYDGTRIVRNGHPAEPDLREKRPGSAKHEGLK